MTHVKHAWWRSSIAVFTVFLFTSCRDPGNSRPQVVSSALPDGVLGRSYSQDLAAQGGAPPYVWSINSGALTEGLSLSGSGQISGLPSAEGTTAQSTAGRTR